MQLPKIGERVTASSSAPPRYVFFIRLSLRGRSPALPLPFHRMKCYTSFSDFECKGTTIIWYMQAFCKKKCKNML